MHEVKVNDSLGKLKNVISTQTLNIRSKQQLETPEMFFGNKRGRKPWSISTNKNQTKVETS
jgi:hypothetical protein